MNTKYYLKVFILFIIFYKCNCNKTHVFNKSICKRLTDNKSLAIDNKEVYYCCKNKNSKPHMIYTYTKTKDILRKYIYVVNIIIIYLILQGI